MWIRQIFDHKSPTENKVSLRNFLFLNKFSPFSFWVCKTVLGWIRLFWVHFRLFGPVLKIDTKKAPNSTLKIHWNVAISVKSCTKVGNNAWYVKSKFWRKMCMNLASTCEGAKPPQKHLQISLTSFQNCGCTFEAFFTLLCNFWTKLRHFRDLLR